MIYATLKEFLINLIVEIYLVYLNIREWFSSFSFFADGSQSPPRPRITDIILLDNNCSVMTHCDVILNHTDFDGYVYDQLESHIRSYISGFGLSETAKYVEMCYYWKDKHYRIVYTLAESLAFPPYNYSETMSQPFQKHVLVGTLGSQENPNLKDITDVIHQFQGPFKDFHKKPFKLAYLTHVVHLENHQDYFVKLIDSHGKTTIAELTSQEIL